MLAIVIPYYKQTFFDITLQSLANQTDKRFKVYVGNDASNENPTNILNKYKDSFNCVYQAFKENIGGVSMVKQWERCISMVDDESWITILGDDDKMDPNFVEEFYNNKQEIDSLSINVIRYSSMKINEFDERISGPFLHPKIENSVDFLMRRIAGDTRSSLSEFIFRKSTLVKIGFKDLPLAWHSDVLGILEFSCFKDIYSINNSIVYFRSSGINISSRNDNLKLKNNATFKFYYYLMTEKKSFFSSDQFNILECKLEKCFLDNKKNLKYWFQFTLLYFLNGNFKKYLRFLRKYFESVLKKIINK